MSFVIDREKLRAMVEGDKEVQELITNLPEDEFTKLAEDIKENVLNGIIESAHEVQVKVDDFTVDTITDYDNLFVIASYTDKVADTLRAFDMEIPDELDKIASTLVGLEFRAKISSYVRETYNVSKEGTE